MSTIAIEVLDADVDAHGVIVRANNWLSSALGYPPGAIDGKRLRDILGVAGRILYETNIAPLLRLQESIGEVSLDLKHQNGEAIPVIMGASSVAENSGESPKIRMVFLHAGERRLYERDLLKARDTAEKGLKLEQADGELREQFVAVLGHDLRNPLASISAATRMLAREDLSDRGAEVIGLMRGSVLRMSGLIDNVLDFARARLGSGIGLDRRAENALEAVLDQVVQELRSSSPDRDVRTSYAIDEPVVCDVSKIGQLASNLLGNALTHGDRAKPILLHADTFNKGIFRLWVANGGSAIPATAMERLFDPFVRGQSQGYKDGLGLGLYIAHEIATAHGGTLTVSSTDEETRFAFEMPTH